MEQKAGEREHFHGKRAEKKNGEMEQKTWKMEQKTGEMEQNMENEMKKQGKWNEKTGVLERKNRRNGTKNQGKRELAYLFNSLDVSVGGRL